MFMVFLVEPVLLYLCILFSNVLMLTDYRLCKATQLPLTSVLDWTLHVCGLSTLVGLSSQTQRRFGSWVQWMMIHLERIDLQGKTKKGCRKLVGTSYYGLYSSCEVSTTFFDEYRSPCFCTNSSAKLNSSFHFHYLPILLFEVVQSLN